MTARSHKSKGRPIRSKRSAATSLPGLSVVLPSYNVDRYLEKCVASLLAEAPELLEVIVVDDGSPDDTPAIADALAAADARIRVIHQANAGCPAARNAGLTAARMKYVGFVDPDDEVEPGWARHLLEAAAIRQPAAIVKGEYAQVDTDGTIRRSSMCLQMVRHGPLYWHGSMWSAIYRRDFLQRHGLQFPGHFFDDVDFQAKALITAVLAHETVTVSPQAVYRYMRREGSLDGGPDYDHGQISGAITTITELHEILKMHAQQLPPPSA